MELIERAGFLASLQGKFRDIETGEGHCVLVSGEAGMGKTSLVRAFCKEKKGECKIYQGTCDALFTPRPLAPLYDIAGQLNPGADIWQNSNATDDRAALFSRFFQELGNKGQVSIIVFEDVHWADEATLDFIKFLARRITRLNCLFILTCRNDEIGSRHPLRNVLGQLPPDSFTRLDLVPLSPGAVEAMAEARGYKGGDVYTISGGNPFYVNEILASYSPGIPDNIKDSILSVYNRQDEKTRQVWEILSVLPTGLEVKLLAALEPFYRTAIENCLDSKILVIKDELIFFKHELYRRTIETSLSPFVRVALNKRMLELFLGDPGHDGQLERIVHHAKNANEYEAVVQYAPLAARRAASVGAHTEAAKLYLSAIEYYQGNDRGTLVELYELYAYECYLTNKHKEAIIYTGRALTVWTQKNDRAKMGNCMRFLSRLWWYEGNRKQSESYGNQSIEVFETLPASKAKAMAYSNMSQLMLSVDRAKDCIKWAKESIALAHEAGDEETLSHSLTNMGTTLSLDPATRREGIDLLEQSLSIALKNAYHEHAARVYAILGANGVTIKDYDMAKTALAEGIAYCEENNLDAQRFFMLSSKARMLLETGDWEEAFACATDLVRIDALAPAIKVGALAVIATIRIRRGEPDAIPLLMDAIALAFDTTELQRIVPVYMALLEYEWLTGKNYVDPGELSRTIEMMLELGVFSRKGRFYFWLSKTGKDALIPNEKFVTDRENYTQTITTDIELWEKWGCPYEYALALFEGDHADKMKALRIVQKLGAGAVYEKMKLEMRNAGIKSIPRGIRKTTQTNPAHLTDREVGVLRLLQEGMQNKEIADKLFIAAKTVDHHITAILFKLEVNSRAKAVQAAIRLGVIK